MATTHLKLLTGDAQVLVMPPIDSGDSDGISEFLTEKTTAMATASVLAAHLYDGYCAWCDENSRPPSRLSFFELELQNKNIRKADVGGRSYYIGVSLKVIVTPYTDVERFHNDCIITKQGSSLTATALYLAYTDWCALQNKEPLALPTFGREFGDLGVKRAKIAGRMRYIGIDTIAPTIKIPEARPAAIAPVWREGKLTTDSSPSQSVLGDEALKPLLESLKAHLRSLLDVMTDCGNAIDKRALKHIETLCSLAPVDKPQAFQLFAFGHGIEALRNYGRIVDAEWPDFVASHYHATIVTLDATMAQFPQWKTFKANAQQDQISPDNLGKVIRAAEVITKELLSDDAKAFVDPRLPHELESIQPKIPDQQSVDLRASFSQRAFDFAEGINNVLKQITYAALQVWGHLKPERDAIRKFSRDTRKQVNKNIATSGTVTGNAVTRWLKRIMLGGIMYILAQSAPSLFAWLGPVMRLIK